MPSALLTAIQTRSLSRRNRSAMTRSPGVRPARAATDGSPIRAAPVRLPGGFLVQTQAGGLYALALN